MKIRTPCALKASFQIFGRRMRTLALQVKAVFSWGFLRHAKEAPDWVPLLHGGERGIRTLGTGLPHTRFPVVRLRPAQPSLRADFGIILLFCPFVKNFCKFSEIFFQISRPNASLLFSFASLKCAFAVFCRALSMIFSLFSIGKFQKALYKN